MKTAKNLTKKQQLKIERLCQKGQHDDARRALLAICEKEPRNIPAWLLLGKICLQVNDIKGATSCYQNVLKIQPGHKESRHRLAGCIVQFAHEQKNQGNMKESVNLYEKALEVDPANLDAHKSIASFCVDHNELNRAIFHLKKVVDYAPSVAVNHSNLGILLERAGGIDRAAESYKKAFELEPNNINYQVSIADLFRYQGDFNEAEAILADVLKNKPEHIRAIYLMLEVYYRKKMPKQATSLLESFIHKDVDGIPSPLLCKFMDICSMLSRCDEAVALASRKLEHSKETESNTHILHFLVGQYQDKHENYDTAFKHIDTGNKIKDDNSGLYEYRLSQMQNVCTLINPGLYAKMPSSHVTSEQPVFIVGMPRSGTSLVEQILTCHPQVEGVGENHDLNTMISDFVIDKAQHKNFPECLFSMSKSDMNTMSSEYLARLYTQIGNDSASRITNKMPDNFLRLTVINKLFPNSRIIHCIRNPMDTCLSIYFQFFEGSHAYAYNLEKLGTFYRGYQEVMRHQTETLGIEVMDIHYEDLVNDQERWSKQLVDYLGLEWDAACLNFDQSGRHVKTASVDQVNKPIYTSSINRWKHYEKYLGPLKEALGYSE